MNVSGMSDQELKWAIMEALDRIAESVKENKRTYCDGESHAEEDGRLMVVNEIWDVLTGHR